MLKRNHNGKKEKHAGIDEECQQRNRNFFSQMKVLEMKNKVTEMKNAFDGLITRLHTAKENISRFEGYVIRYYYPNRNTKRNKE